MDIYFPALIAYLLGSVPTGYIIGSRAGIDVRKAGSGNVGATNVARVVGKRQGIFTLIADTAKGLVPVVIALKLGLAPVAVVAVGIAAFLGHLYPIFLKFRGGKGVATAFGVFLGLAPWAAGILMLIFAVVVRMTRVVSLGSMVTAACAPLVLWLLHCSPALIVMGGFIAAMIIFRHRENIRRLFSGTEPKLSMSNSR
jgi:acyl phosphate:glycerol-3-phosphate acyltransferase